MAPIATSSLRAGVAAGVSAAKGAMSARPLSTRASQVLAAVGLPTGEQVIPGVFDGKWGGSGAVIETKCPATGEILARVQTVSLFF